MLSEPNDVASFPFNIPLFKGGFSITFDRAITIISGENGSGKSTLLEAIARRCGFNLSGGDGSHLYESKNHVKQLSDKMTFRWLPKISKGFFFRSESFYNFSSYIDDLTEEFGKGVLRPYGGVSLHKMSHGEAFLSLFNNRIRGPGLFIFDEPEAALSPTRQLVFLAILKNLLDNEGAQVIIATHSPIIMSYPNCRFLRIEDGVIEEADYTKTEHYIVTKQFLSNPAIYLKAIFDD